MKKYRLATIFLIAIMATGILTVATPLTSADPWSPNRGPPIVINGDVGDWDPIKPINLDPLGDTQLWSKDGTTNKSTLIGSGMYENPAQVMFADLARDLKSLSFWFTPATAVYVKLEVAALVTPGFGYAPGALNWSLYAITFSTNLTANTGAPLGLYDGLFYPGACSWEYILVFSEFWCLLVGYNGTGTEIVDTNPAGATMYPPPGTPNMTMAVDYAAGSIELYIPREDFTQWWYNAPMGVVSIACMSAKPGLVGNPAIGEDNILHPFDPQAVILGTSPPIAGEEFLPAMQPTAWGPDHADLMAPTIAVIPYPPYGYMVQNQKFVDMSPLACIDVVDTVTGQQNITNTYAKNTNFTVDIWIYNALNLTGISLGLTWDPTVLKCWSFKLQFGDGTFLGDSADWIVGSYGTVNNTIGKVYPPCGAAWTGAISGPTGPTGNGIMIKAKFGVLVDYGSTWICPDDFGIVFGILTVEVPIKNAWFENIKPPPGPPEPPVLDYDQTPPAPPHYIGDTITFNLGSSTPGFNGTDDVPILNYSLTVTNSSGVIYSVEDNNPIKSFTPLSPDTYTFTLDIRLDPLFDPAYTAAHPEWMHIEEDVVKKVEERPVTGIDCFTERARRCGYETDFVGKGHDIPADAYSLDEEVTIYSYVFYRGWPKQSFIVSFEIYAPNGSLVLVRTAMTNEQGIASISFRILTVCMNPRWAFGKWRCFQKVYMCELPYNDTLWFDVGYLVELLTVTPVEPQYEYPAHLAFRITGKNIAMISRKVVWSIVVYDNDSVPIAAKTGEMWVDPGRYCDPKPFEFVIDCLAIPKWFYPGTCKVYVNAWFNGLPTKCGHPACPEISGSVYVKAPPFVPDP